MTVKKPTGLTQTIGVLRDAIQGYTEDGVPRLGAALAYHTIFTIGPLLLLAVGLAGLVLDREKVVSNIKNQVLELFGSSSLPGVLSILDRTENSGLGATISGSLILLWTASNFFVQLQDSLNQIWHTEARRSPMLQMVFGRLLAAVFAIVMGLLTVAFLSANVYAVNYGQAHFGDVPGAPILLKFLSALLSVLVFTLMFGALYRFLPNLRLSWQDVSFGAGVTAILFVLGQYAISFYLARFSPASTFGAAGTLVVFMLWVYFSAQLFFFGAELTWAYSNKFGSVAAAKQARLAFEAREREAKEREAAAAQTVPPTRPPPLSKATFSVAGFLGGVAITLLALPAALVFALSRVFQRRSRTVK